MHRHGRVVHVGFVLESTQTSSASAPAAAHSHNGVTAPAGLATPKRRSREGGWAFGPGLVHLLAAIGPNDLVANSLVAATYGYSLLWTLIPAYMLHFFIAEASARYVMTTGESIVEGFARLGRTVMIVLAGAIVLRRHLNNLFLVPMMGQSLHMLVPLPFGPSALLWSIVCAVLAFTLMAKGGYSGVERRGKSLVALLTGSLLVVAVMARADPGAIVAGLFAPTWPGADAVVLLMALAASTVGSINHLKYPAFVFEKGWRDVSVRRKQRVDLALSCLGQLSIAALIQIAVAATLRGVGAEIKTLQDLSRVFSTYLGEPGRIVFGIGMWATVSSSYIGSNTGYSLIVADVYERFLRRPFDFAQGRPEDVAQGRPGAGESRDAVRRRAYVFFLTLFCVSPLYVLFTSWEPLWIGIVASAIFFGLAPLLLIGLLALTTNGVLMREQHVSGWMSKVMIGLAIVLSLALTYRSLSDLLARLFGPSSS
jgi:Mn2+/Fe2+ NRAMP family transporter